MRKQVIGVLVGTATLFGMAGPASAAATNQRFTISARFNGNNTSGCRVVASGPIQGAGTCTITDVSRIVTDVHLVFPNGTVDLRAKQYDSSDDFNQQACIDNFTFKENFKITGGTGAYANASGSGTDIGSGVFVAARTPNGCDPSQGRGAAVVNATGNVKL